MKTLCLLVGAAAFLLATGAVADSDHAFNAVDFQVPADELDAAAVGEAAVHSGFLPLSEADPRIKAGRAAPDAVYEIWELPSHKVASITLTRMARTGKFIGMFVAKDSGRRNDPLTGDACKRWLKFSASIRIEFMHQPTKFRFRNPQCTP